MPVRKCALCAVAVGRDGKVQPFSKQVAAAFIAGQHMGFAEGELEIDEELPAKDNLILQMCAEHREAVRNAQAEHLSAIVRKGRRKTG